MVQDALAYKKIYSRTSGRIDDSQVTGPLVTDAALAALALEHGAWLCTSDRDFRRFPTVRVVFAAVGLGTGVLSAGATRGEGGSDGGVAERVTLVYPARSREDIRHSAEVSPAGASFSEI